MAGDLDQASRRGPAARLTPGPVSHRALLVAAGALLAAGSASAQTLPQGGTVVHGGVTIGAPANGTMTIRQSTDRGIINWNSFSVGSAGTVNFQQPSATAATLNRVTGATSTTIAGRINANGQVYLVNPNGIQITSTGTIDTAGFTASALGISNGDFIAGRNIFSGNGASATVHNDGRIRVRRGGDAVLIGGRVVNNGDILAPGGRVGLAAGEHVSVDVEGDGFLTVSVPSSDPHRTQALISHTGRIRAQGGRVEARAATTADIARAAINISGQIEAGSVRRTPGGVSFGGGTAAPASGRRPETRLARAPARNGGRIAIDGGASGQVAISGRISATSQRAKGGDITITGHDIALSDARIDASGATGGGGIRIGGDYQGGDRLARASTLSVDLTSTIAADATTIGNGGRIILWSDQFTSYAGALSARGGSFGGNGGFAEVSGKAKLDFTGRVDALAPMGTAGTLLLDPYDITISNAADSNQSGFAATGNDSIINVATLQATLAGANVIVTTGAAGSAGSQAGDITVAANITWTAATKLTLSAYRDITISHGVSISNATAGAGLVLRADNSGTGVGTVNFGTGSTASLAAGSVEILYNPTAYTTPTNYAGNVTGALRALMLVNDVFQLQALNTNLAGRYALGRNIDASATAAWNGNWGFVPIGNASMAFTGVLDGQGHVISGLTIKNWYADYVGLIGNMSGSSALISNIGLVDGSISGRNSVGGLVGANRGGTVQQSYTTGPVSGSGQNVGGLVGLNDSGGAVRQSYATGAVDGVYYVGGLVGTNRGVVQQGSASGRTSGEIAIGGLVGANFGGTVWQSFASGVVYGSGGSVGGLIGSNNNGGTVRQSYSTGAVTGSNSAGGLVGTNFESTVEESYATGRVLGHTSGGLVGTNNGGTVRQSYATGAVGTLGGSSNVGGLVGHNNGTVEQSYATGQIAGQDYVGGLVGRNDDGNIRQSYATGTVAGVRYVGGLVGANVTGTVGQSYATGAVTGSTSVGGLIGLNNGTLTATYWDRQTSGQPTVGIGGGSNVSGAIGLDTADMTNGATYRTIFAGFDFDTAWTPAGNGFRPQLYGVSGVVGVRAANTTMSYGDTVPDTLTYLGVGYWNTITSAATQATSVNSTSGIGGYAVTASGGSATFTPGGASRIVHIDGALTVAPRTLTITADARSRIYGEANPVLTYTIGGAGLVNGDALAGSLATAATTTSGVGAYAITLGTLATSPNYAVTYRSADLTIAPRTLTVTANAQSRAYGEGNPALTYLISGAGLVNGDTLTGGLATAATTALGVGDYTITQGTLAASPNYFVTYQSANLTVTQRALTIAADAQNRTYGDANPTMTYTIGGAGLVNGDILTGGLATVATALSGAGSYAITQGTLAASPNYAVTYQGAGLTVVPRALTITADIQSRAYGATNPALAYAIGGAGMVNGDTLSGELATAATTASGVGTYAITQGTLVASPNYAVTYRSADLTITQRALTITADAQSRTYGEANPTMTYTIGGAGLVNGDTLTGELATAATTASGVGSYAIAQNTLAISSNYAVTFQGADLTVTPRALTIAANALSRSYGDANPALTYQLTSGNLVGTDTLAGGLGTAANTASGIGNYGISQGTLGNNNYSITYIAADLTVTPRALTITASAQSRVYGDANPTSGAGTANNLANGDSLAGVSLTTAATAASGVGVYDLAGSSAVFSAGSAANYAITYVTLAGGLTVTPRALAIAADDQSRLYGQPDPALSYRIMAGSLVNGDSLTGALVRAAGDAPGSYDILIGSLAASANYQMTFRGGQFRIEPAPSPNVFPVAHNHSSPHPADMAVLDGLHAPVPATSLTAGASPRSGRACRIGATGTVGCGAAP